MDVLNYHLNYLTTISITHPDAVERARQRYLPGSWSAWNWLKPLSYSNRTNLAWSTAYSPVWQRLIGQRRLLIHWLSSGYTNSDITLPTRVSGVWVTQGAPFPI